MHTKIKTLLTLNRLISAFIVVSLVLTQVIEIQTVSAFNLYPRVDAEESFMAPKNIEHSDMVAVLVSKDIYDNGDDFEGLNEKYDGLKNNTVKYRVERYAEDIAKVLPKTKVKIIIVENNTDAPRKIYEVLDKLYFEGEEVKNTVAQLRGIVLIGNIPLPEVEKAGKKFTTIFPYTDFDERAYVYDYTKNAFVSNPSSLDPTADVWHGVIPGTPDEIATYLDKNHLYHTGNKDFTDFEQKIFYADLNRENETMTRAMYKNYEEYTNSLEKMAYYRYTKEWLIDLMKKFNESIAADVEMDTADQEVPAASAGQKIKSNGKLQSIAELTKSSNDNLKKALTQGTDISIPDIFTKFLVEKYAFPYYKLFEKHLSEVNDFVAGSGRWNESSVDTAISLISKKDLDSREFLKQINNSVEKKVDEIVEKLQKPIPLIRYVEVSGYTNLQHDATGNIVKREAQMNLGFKNSEMSKSSKAEACLFPYFNDSKNLVFLSNGLDHYMKDDGWKSYINGVSYENLNSAEQCSLWRGNVSNDDSKAAKMLRTGNLSTLNTYEYPKESLADPKKPPTPRKSPSIGVNAKVIDKASLNALGISGGYEYGFLVAPDLKTGVPAVYAEAANDVSKILAEGDVLLSIDGKKLTQSYDVAEAMKPHHPDIYKVTFGSNGLPDKAYDTAEVEFWQKSSGKITKANIGIIDANSGNDYARKPWEVYENRPWSADCYAVNMTTPEKCFPSFATIPVYDEAGAYATKNESKDYLKSQSSYRACYDFNIYESPANSNADVSARHIGMAQYLYEAKLRDDTSLYAYVPGVGEDPWLCGGVTYRSNSYIKNSGKYGPAKAGEVPKAPTQDPKYLPLTWDNKFTLFDLLKIYASSQNLAPIGFDGFKSKFLETAKTEIISISMKADGGFESKFIKPDVFVLLEPHFYPDDQNPKTISSIIRHKNPTNEMLGMQLKSKSAEALPIDDPRYVTFKNKLDNKETTLLYPNAFVATTYDNLLIQLKSTESDLAKLSGENYDGVLTSILQNGVEAYSKDNGRLLGTFDIVDENKAKDAVAWKNMNIDEKHAYMIQTSSNPEKPYEVMYLNAKGGNDFIDINFNGNAPKKDSDDEYNELISQVKLDAEDKKIEGEQAAAEALSAAIPNAKDALTKDAANKYTKPYKYNGQDAVIIFKWVPAVMQWVKDLQKQAGQTLSFANGPSDSDGSDNSSKDSASLKITPDRNVLGADGGDSISVKVEAMNSSGKISSKDNETAVTLKINPESGLETSINGEGSAPLFEGYATFNITSGTKVEDFTLSAVGKTPNGRALSSNAIQMSVVKKKISIVTPEELVKADNKTPFTIKVNVYGENGNIDEKDSSTIALKVSDESKGFVKISKDKVKTKSGVAEFTASPTNKSGMIEFTASVDGGGAPDVTSEFSTLPEDPTKLELVASPSILKAGGGKTKVIAALYDSSGNMATGESSSFKFEINGPGNIIGAKETVSFSGQSEVEIESTAETGEINLSVEAKYGETALNSTVKIQSRNDLIISTETSSPEILANGKAKTIVMVYAKDSSGKIINNYYGPITFAPDDSSFGNVTENTSTEIQNGMASSEFMASKKAGTVKIGTSVPGFDPVITEIKTLPLAPHSVIVTSDKNSLISDGVSTATLKVNLLDENKNVINDGKYAVQLKLTNDTKNYGKFAGSGAINQATVNYENGAGQIDIASTLISGSMHIIASSGSLEKSAVEIFSAKRFFATDLDSKFLGSLYATVLGDNFGDLTGQNSLAKKMLVNGKTQAVMTSLSADWIPQNGYGFTGQNKYAMLLAGGNIVGEATLPYISEYALVLGDPTIRLSPNQISQTGYTKDLGQQIYAGSDKIQSIIPIDYNSDKKNDLFVAYESGKIRLLENVGGNEKFKNRGIILDVVNGINYATASDINNDGQTDFVVATKRGCKKEDVCVDLYKNNNGYFTRENFPIKTSKRVNMIVAEDFNKDGFKDLAVSDSVGTVRIFYNNNGNIASVGQKLGNLGVQIDPTENLSSNVLVYHSGIKITEAPPIPGRYTLALPDKSKTTNIPEMQADFAATMAELDKFEGEVDPMAKTIETDFAIYNSDNAKNAGVTIDKRASVAKEELDVGDIMNYTITVKAKTNVSNLWLADRLNGFTEIDKNSIKYNSKPCDTTFKCYETGDAEAPYILGGVSIPSGTTVKITYSAKITTLPKINITAIKNSPDVPVASDIPAILANPEGNTSGSVVYFYPNGDPNPATNTTSFTQISAGGEEATTDAGEKAKDPFEAVTDLFKTTKTTLPGFNLADSDNEDGATEIAGGGDSNTLPEGVKKEMEDYNNQLMSNDSDMDGTPDLLDDVNNAYQAGAAIVGDAGKKLDEAANAIESGIAALRCSGGCIPTPINIAFLVPGMINVMGVPSGFTEGLPVFGTGCPNITPIWPPTPYQSSNGFRLYISPTLTAKVGMGFCTGGPYLTGQCFTVAPPIPSGGLCDTIASGMSNAVSQAGSVAQSGISGMTTIVSDPAGDSSGKTSGFKSSPAFKGYKVANISGSKNISIPGFPAVIAKWLDRQIEEAVNKLGDGPDIYFIYPKWSSITGSVQPQKTNFTGIKQLLTYINSIPIIQIEGRDVMLRVPTLTKKEVDKAVNDYKAFKRDLDNEIERVKSKIKCKYDAKKGGYYAPEPYEQLCSKLTINAAGLSRSIEKNIDALEQWKMFPKKVIEFRNFEAKYARQIINYLTVITDYVGGYMQRQQHRIEAWMEAIKKIKKILENWQLLLDIMVDYQTSCDSCKSDRFSLLEILLKIFAAIPDPPVVQFPKIPDIVLDVSQIQAGIKIIWPDLIFMPEKLVIPPLPRLKFPDIVPGIEIELFELPVIPAPPPLPDLPNLPPLPLIKLPDLPPAPIIPDLPSAIKKSSDILKKLMKILCLLKKGFTPVPETSLKTEIENITQRSLNPPLSIDISMPIQTPAISYSMIDRITVEVKINAQVKTEKIYDSAKKLADTMNEYTHAIVKVVNSSIMNVRNAVDKATQPNINVPNVQLNKKLGTFKENNNPYINLVATQTFINPKDIPNAINFKNVSGDSYIENLKSSLIAYTKSSKNLAYDAPHISRFLASAGGIPIPDSIAKMQEEASKTATPRGIFIYNKEQNVNEKLVNYIEDIRNNSQIIYLDADNDGDEDVILSFNGDIYLKENYKIAHESDKHFTGFDDDEIDDLLPNASSVNAFAADYKNKSATFTWMPSGQKNLAGYEITYRGTDGVHKVRLALGEPKENEEKLVAGTSPTYSLTLENGVYYAQIASFDTDNNYSTISGANLLAPQICSDTSAPMPNAGPSKIRTPVLKAVRIDASGSIDQGGEVTSYFIDTNLEKDDNGDSDPTNDKNMNNGSNPIFMMGPYEDLGFQNIKVYAVDQSGNMAGQDIEIEVYSPDVELTAISYESKNAYGKTVPPESEMPITLVRDRNGKVDTLGEYITNSKGEFKAEPLSTEGKIVIKNSKGEIVAEYDEATGKLTPTKEGYYLDITPSTGGMPPMINLRDKDSNILISIFYIADANTDTKLDSLDIEYTQEDVKDMVGVHSKDINLEDEFVFRKIAGDDPTWFGSTEIIYKNNNKRIALIDTLGNVYILDSRAGMRLKSVNPSDPYVLEILFDGKVIGEVFVSIKLPAPLNLVSKDMFAKNFGTNEIVKNPGSKNTPSFKDIPLDSKYSNAVETLKKRGIIQGYTDKTGEYFRPEQNITRAEFTKMILRMLCIFPGKEAKSAPAVFNDIPFTKSLPWYFDYTKEAFLRELIFGYLGEQDANGMNPFKPQANISLAEAVKIVIEALYMQKIIDFERPGLQAPWYKPYIFMGQDLTPFLKSVNDVNESFIITTGQARDPEKLLTRGEFAEIANRVINVYDCSNLDSDKDGMTDIWEADHALNNLMNDADDDPDKDGLKNIQEYQNQTDPLNPDTDGDGLKDGEEIFTYKTSPINPDTDGDMLTDGEEVLKYMTNPLNPDTDFGGVPDGVEVKRGTDPLDPLDDFGKSDSRLPPGVYGILADCNACPCPATIEHTAQLLPGDIIYATITNKKHDKIFSKSNEIIVNPQAL
ncbi:MAG: Peptidoglycan-associated outer membrane protein [Candidatus Peregrinibacteria bacterium GW2011_GWC2_39_14]|nr:MAG: Peptidoglycan-associated outer membrane protein [Candidatus Peregrinibacteria bacterium GW2011_GWA2_38_36]KKR06644.1 MAG: Peptidoglycan-associated outer membrane protein [Candidatus Peregrinibacteria bacterium GW2011_GWC2_39_14]